jgi:hypothetical protein
MAAAHEAAMDLFGTCFPNYRYFRVIPNVRLTTTLFERAGRPAAGFPDLLKSASDRWRPIRRRPHWSPKVQGAPKGAAAIFDALEDDGET